MLTNCTVLNKITVGPQLSKPSIIQTVTVSVVLRYFVNKVCVVLIHSVKLIFENIKNRNGDPLESKETRVK